MMTTMLTERQRQVLIYAASGHSLNETAELLHLSHNTVAEHRLRAMRTLEATTIPNAVAIALRKELIR